MTKKTKPIQPQTDLLPDPVAPQPNPYFKMGKWKEFTTWQCLHCQYDTLEGEAELMAHWMAAHAPKPAPQPAPLIQSFDRFGRPINPQSKES